MDNIEIREIKKTLKPEHAAVDQIVGCHVDGGRNITPLPPQRFAALPEEEAEQYLTLFSKVLSGSDGRNLHTVEFPLQTEADASAHALLMKMRESRLEDGESTGELFARIANAYASPDPYFILAMSGDYDVPVKSDDAMGDPGESDSVFPHLILAICPAAISKPGLAYRANKIEDIGRNLLIAPPAFGLLFPAFHDRTADIHAMLCFTKKHEPGDEAIVTDVFGCMPPAAPEAVKEGFSSVVSEVLGENCTFENVASIQEMLKDAAEETTSIGKSELWGMLESIGTPNSLEHFDEKYEEAFHDAPIPVSQVLPSKATVKTDDITISCPAEYLGLITVKEVDGKRCIVIEPDGNVEINGTRIV